MDNYYNDIKKDQLDENKITLKTKENIEKMIDNKGCFC